MDGSGQLRFALRSYGPVLDLSCAGDLWVYIIPYARSPPGFTRCPRATVTYATKRFLLSAQFLANLNMVVSQWYLVTYKVAKYD